MPDITRRQFMKYAMASGATLLLPRFAMGANWPDRPITGVIAFSAGGGTDTIARAISGGMEEFIGGTINNINKTGATGSVGTGYVWEKPSNGYWLLFISNFNKTLRATKKDHTIPWKDWQFYRLTSTTMSFSVLPDSPIKDFGDLIERAKKNPGKVKMSNAGSAGVWHLGTLLLERSVGVKFHNVPYEGGKKATLAALQGEVEVVGSGLHEQIGNIKAGRLRHLAVFDSEPMTLGGIHLDPVTKYAPEIKNDCPYGGGTTPALKRDTDPVILNIIADAFEKAQNGKKYSALLESKGINKMFAKGAQADKMAAKYEVTAATLLYESGFSKITPQDLGYPKLEAFEDWWPPKDYKAVI